MYVPHDSHAHVPICLSVGRGILICTSGMSVWFLLDVLIRVPVQVSSNSGTVRLYTFLHPPVPHPHHRPTQPKHYPIALRRRSIRTSPVLISSIRHSSLRGLGGCWAARNGLPVSSSYYCESISGISTLLSHSFQSQSQYQRGGSTPSGLG